MCAFSPNNIIVKGLQTLQLTILRVTPASSCMIQPLTLMELSVTLYSYRYKHAMLAASGLFLLKILAPVKMDVRFI